MVQDLHPNYYEYLVKYLKREHTLVLSLFTSASNPSLETFAGRLTAGAIGLPSSSDTN